ncbi:hypothetical protein LZF95_09870 [Algoriphagus sp. AGSA1]|uniref:hypothetical protein n=1 Tax=Algoriphagus sp. AGSA1 TaxID=2907213 RepID=UPI001F205F72|nr:hypothetical protein [Algoriphagus sp. AGSA1]MCE7054980.1 hypothetical protein [Algoriphagus sp. AGSA1]
MRFLGILFIFLNIASFLSSWAGFSPAGLESSLYSTQESGTSELSAGPNFILDEAIALPNYFFPTRPAVQRTPHFFKSNAVSVTYFCLSNLCISSEHNYLRSAFSFTPGLTALLIIFPHHYFT